MKKILALTLVLALALGTMSLSAFAAIPPTESNATIEFEAGDLVVVDPTDPANPIPIDPTDPNTDPNKYLDLGAINIVFAKTKITGLNQLAIPAATGSEKTGMVVQNASGSTGGWTVTLKMSDEFKNTAGTKELTGAQINLTALAGSVVGPNAISTEQPTQTSVGIKKADTAKTIFTSGVGGKGSQGFWGGSWTPTLDIFQGTAEAINYTSTLVWTVTAG